MKNKPKKETVQIDMNNIIKQQLKTNLNNPYLIEISLGPASEIQDTMNNEQYVMTLVFNNKFITPNQLINALIKSFVRNPDETDTHSQIN